MTLRELFEYLSKNKQEYEYEFKTKFGRDNIVVKKDTFRGAEIFNVDDRFQILAMIPTFKGKLLFGSGISLAPRFIKNYGSVANDITEEISTKLPDVQLTLISNAMEIERTGVIDIWEAVLGVKFSSGHLGGCFFGLIRLIK